MSDAFAVDGIDHVELYVSDREDAADWYERVLGVVPDEEFEQWWRSETGPLVLTPEGGTTKLALFEHASPTTGAGVSPHRVAFRVDGAGFLAFLDRLEDLDLVDREGEVVTEADVVDHDISYSIYFADPDGNPLEVTTYDYEDVADAQW